MAETEWHNRTRFAEAAETLEITTDCVMAAIDQGDFWAVLYTETPETDEHDWIHYAVLVRDGQRVLQIQTERLVMRMGEFQGNYDDLIRRATED